MDHYLNFAYTFLKGSIDAFYGIVYLSARSWRNVLQQEGCAGEVMLVDQSTMVSIKRS